MTDILEITFGLADAELEDDERLKFAKKLLPELRQLDEVQKADRTEDLDTETGAKGFSTLAGFLTAEVSIANIKTFLGWMGDRLQDKPIKGKVKIGDSEVEFEVKSRQELAELEQTTLKLIEALRRGPNA